MAVNYLCIHILHLKGLDSIVNTTTKKDKEMQTLHFIFFNSRPFSLWQLRTFNKPIRLRRQLIRKDAFSPMCCEDKGDSKRGTANGAAGWRTKERDSNRRVGIAIKGVASGGEGGQAKGTQGIMVSQMAFFPSSCIWIPQAARICSPFRFSPTHPPTLRPCRIDRGSFSAIRIQSTVASKV